MAHMAGLDEKSKLIELSLAGDSEACAALVQTTSTNDSRSGFSDDRLAR
jgi:hypothetical protein